MNQPRTRLVLCGELAAGAGPEDAVRVRAGPTSADGCNLTVGIDGIERCLTGTLPPRIEDLLLIAAYVLTADGMVFRGDLDAVNLGATWHRNWQFRIPVLDVEFWRQREVTDTLCRALGFVADETFGFEFVPRLVRDSRQLSLRQPDRATYLPWDHVDSISLLSGGLDSFSGAVDQLSQGRRVIFVSHRPSPIPITSQDNALRLLNERYPGLTAARVGIRTPRHGKGMDRERSQRTRSFLFTALAGAVAALTGKDRFTFYENGIVSFNLPVSQQVIGAAASRTTHPLGIRDFARLLSCVFDRPFTIENPFLYLTRAEVIGRLIPAEMTHAILATNSCAHVTNRSKDEPHCGICSQCVDRRVALESLGLRFEEDKKTYGHQLFSDPIAKEVDRLYAVAYVDAADRWATMKDPATFLQSFGEAARAISGALEATVPSTDETLRALFDLHRRHGNTVAGVLDRVFGEQRRSITSRGLPATSLPMLLIGRDRPESGASASSATTTHVFKKDGSTWFICFPGDPGGHIPDTLGMGVLHKLLAANGKRVSVLDLAGNVLPRRATRDLGDKTDAKTLGAVEKRREALEEQLAEAEEMTDADAIIDIKRELAALATYRNASVVPGGRIKKENPAMEAARQRTRKHIATAFQKLADNSGLVQHLSENIKNIHGIHPSYVSPSTVWDLGA